MTKDRSNRSGNEHSYHSKTHLIRRKASEPNVATETAEGEQACDDPLAAEEQEQPQASAPEPTQGEELEEEEEERHPSLFNWLSNNGNIQLCLDTKELQVYTGDATRYVLLLVFEN